MKKLLKILSVIFLLAAFQPFNYTQSLTVKLFTPHSSIKGYDINSFWTIKVDSKGVIWAGSKYDDLFKYENGVWTDYVPDGAGDLTGMTVDKDDNIWLGSNGLTKAIEFSGTAFSYYPAPDSLSPKLFSVVTQGDKIWYGGEDEGLFLCAGQSWTKYDQADTNTPFKYVRSLINDSKGNIWFAAKAETQPNVNDRNKYVLVKHNGQNFYVVSTEQSQRPFGALYGIAPDKNGNIWYANIDSNLVKYDDQNFTVFDAPGENKLGFVFSLAVDNNSNIWVSSDNGLFKYNTTSAQWTQYKYSDLGLVNGNPGSEVRDIVADAGNNLWMASNWGIVEFNENGIIAGIDDHLAQTPASFLLSQNYPNPFNPATAITYQIPKESFVTIKVYDILGREIKQLVNEQKPAGSYEVSFNAASLASGTYFYRITAGAYTSVKKMILMK